jgi:hypothetical protein
MYEKIVIPGRRDRLIGDGSKSIKRDGCYRSFSLISLVAEKRR